MFGGTIMFIQRFPASTENSLRLAAAVTLFIPIGHDANVSAYFSLVSF
jgi:hypothetical protein